MALIFQDFTICFLASVERHAYLPWSREDIRVLDCRFIEQVIRARRCIAFNDVQGITVVIPCAVEPGSVIESARLTGASAAGESPARRRRLATTLTPSHGPPFARMGVKR